MFSSDDLPSRLSVPEIGGSGYYGIQQAECPASPCPGTTAAAVPYPYVSAGPTPPVYPPPTPTPPPPYIDTPCCCQPAAAACCCGSCCACAGVATDTYAC
ncbi:hypothetical protein CHLRE_02g141426v5 [Chlamydomonas reinhardtii]|uniref:Uncharacterized protein n=1 Tax=Chlamydomonas reinhardtii TaxID=3055 RepID=A0A2K3E499_CHLRE|nr:uncharacterized protein CHLRE_02g141426v5 [Chlamydomonas reinhardtii]PNW87601.1 hypothetical protein CHLRE_02g141426v5 [Chlamydomonas reinhardtii]